MNTVIEKLRAWGCDVDGAMRRMLGDEGFYMECLKTIPDDEHFGLLSRALTEKNAKAGFESAHTLKGILANLGLTPMLNKINEIVEPLRAGKCENLYEKYTELCEMNDYLASVLYTDNNTK